MKVPNRRAQSTEPARTAFLQSAHTRRNSSERPTSSFPWVESSGRQSVDQGQGSGLCAIKHRLNSCLEQSSATTLSIGTPRCSLLCYNPPKEPPPLSSSQREGIKRGTPTTSGSGWMGRAGAQQHQAERGKSKAQSDLAIEIKR